MSAVTARGTMAAAVLHGPGDLRVEQRPVPEATAGHAVVEVSHCGVCGSDLHFVLEGWGRPGSIGGHEWSGTVVAVGADVTTVAVGDHVVGGPAAACGECRPCREGRRALCVERTAGSSDSDGAFATYVRAPHDSLIPVPDGLDLRTAALAEPLAVALHAITRSGVTAGERVLVTGAGPIGTLVLAALAARGVSDVMVSEPHPGRQALATALGATRVVAPDALDVPSIAEPQRLADHPVDVAFECSGAAAAMEAACAQLDRGGRLVLVGAGMHPPRFDPNRILLNELVITGAYEYDPDGVAEAVALLASGAVDVSPIVEPRDVPLDELLDAMRALAEGSLAGKVLTVPTRTTEEQQ